MRRLARNIFGVREMETDQDEYVEITSFNSDKPVGKLGIKVEKLNDFSDTERILKSVRAGHIVFLKIKGLKEKDIDELKRAVDKLKKTIIANNGDIVGVEQDWLILTPHYADIEREL